MQIIQQISAVVVGFTLFVGSAAAQDQELRGKVEELQTSYEQAWVAGDADALASLFTEDAIFWPLSGGSFEGREAILQSLQQGPHPEAADIRSARSERLGDLVFDVGTFTMTLPEPENAVVEGEYAVVAEETEDGLMIRRLISFQPRRPMEEPQ